ncbi:hypothetical protein FHS43_004975 [Streptosporangium becharense]|uniref:Uncharacterized protein n=1 Tax=Streptosporangium becharense TaxID=1816182 RepID=A0A7W9IBM9_9ACTN|nr:hypothetical protein [Streptosporangium becharense]MBB2913666.1 hypothetical protein [Streptosporangium becharense]MBB5817747.1 hypothetical protein [Streptosporangium becharense]
MVIVQRVVVRWGKQGRGAAEATRRRSLPEAFPLPPALPGGPLVLHDVTLDEADGYTPVTAVGAHPLPHRAIGLRFSPGPPDDGNLRIRVERMPVGASYPRHGRIGRLFLLDPGQRARYRANFRFTGCQCAAAWHFEQWTISIGHTGPSPDLFCSGGFDAEVDDRVSLYGGR